MPILGFILGLAAVASSLAYFVMPDKRPIIERVFQIASEPRGRKTGLAVATLLWALIMVMGSVGTWMGNREDAEQAEQQAKAQADKQAADNAARDELLTSAAAKIDTGDLDGAKTDLAAAEKYGRSEADSALHQRLADALHERDLASLPDLLEGLRGHNAAQEWDAALGDCVRAKAIDSEFTGLAEACAEASEGQRVASIPGWIEAASTVAEDKERCETPVDIAEAWKNLRQVKPDDPGYKKAKSAAAKLEKCRKKSEKAFSKGLREIMVSQREGWAERYELNLLDQGLDVRVKLSGKHKNRAKIRWILLSRAGVHQIVKDGAFLTELEKIGFEKVTFSDGYWESWTYDLEPQSEANGGKAVLAEFGLDKPLSL